MSRTSSIVSLGFFGNWSLQSLAFDALYILYIVFYQRRRTQIIEPTKELQYEI